VAQVWRQRRAGEGLGEPAADPSLLTTPRPRRATPSAWSRLADVVRPDRPSRWVSLAAGASAGLALAYLGASDGYVIRGATVHGNRRVPAEAIYRASGLEGRRVFGVDGASAEARIETLGGVRSARVEIGWPNRASIAVEETALWLLWEGPIGALAVDERGVPAPVPEDTAGLARVRDRAALLADAGGRLPEALVAAARTFGEQFGDLEYHRDGGFVAFTTEGWPVRLGTDAGRIVEQAATLGALRARLAAAGRPVEVIDLRFAKGSYYRLKEEAP